MWKVKLFLNIGMKLSVLKSGHSQKFHGILYNYGLCTQ